MFDFIKPDRPNWRHYFGSFALIILILQVMTGLILTAFYEPTLAGAYKSVQYLTNEITGGSLSRNLHRWIALALMMASFVHFTRSSLRKDFMNPHKRVDWLTGVLLMLPLFLLLYTGLVLPWEWKGYWYMEMIASYAGALPVMGPDLKAFFLMTFTLPRYLVVHILVLPLLSLIIVDYHLLTKLRKRGIFRHLSRHFIITLPLTAALVALSIYLTIPSLDPAEIPMPLEGAYIPEPEWFGFLFLMPFKSLKGIIVPVLAIYIPLFLFISVGFMPYYLRGKSFDKNDDSNNGAGAESDDPGGEGVKKKAMGPVLVNIVRGLIIFAVTAVFFGLVYWGSYESPTLGCNSCHNLSRGIRMGVPPETFRIRKTLPNLDDDKWMMGHWFYPNEIY